MFDIIIETPKGSRCKFTYDSETKLFRLQKLLPTGVMLPYNLGIIPFTRDDEGEELQVLVLMEEPVFPGCVVPMNLIGVLAANLTEKNGRTTRCERLIGIPETKENISDVRSLDDLDIRHLEDIEHFFISYNRMEGNHYRPSGRFGPNKAEALVKEGLWRYDFATQVSQTA